MFNIDEAFEMAEQIERDGAKFYRIAAENVTEVEGKDLLLELARMEDEHEVVFANLRKKIVGQDWQDAAYDPEGEAAYYLQSFAKGRVFDSRKDISEKFSGIETLADLLGIAIQFERDTIAFFTGIQDVVPESLGKDKVTSIIREEMGHVTLLSRRLERLS